MSRRIDWGDIVRVKPSAPEEYRPGSIGDVCGIRTTKRMTGVIDVSDIPDQEELIVLVEFTDGAAVEVPERMLELLQQDTGYSDSREQREG
jgi:hypothetical protein